MTQVSFILPLFLAAAGAAQPASPSGYGTILANERVAFPGADGSSPAADYAVAFDLLNHGMMTDSAQPQNWDGVHVALRFQDDCRSYYASVNRRDNRIVIKKKIPDGRSPCGSFYNLSDYAAYAAPLERWQKVRAMIATLDDGSVEIKVYVDGQLMARGIDKDVGGPPILDAGAVVLRADNADVDYQALHIEPLQTLRPFRQAVARAPRNGLTELEPSNLAPADTRLPRQLPTLDPSDR